MEGDPFIYTKVPSDCSMRAQLTQGLPHGDCGELIVIGESAVLHKSTSILAFPKAIGLLCLA